MTQVVKRRNAEALRWLRAATFASTTAWALANMSFSPGAAAYGIALAVGVVALFAPGIAVLIAVIAMSLPLLAANLLVGAIFLVVGFAAIQYLGQDDGRAFLAIITAFIAATYGPVWGVIAIAGYMMGASEGAIAAILACLVIEAAGLVTGTATIGLIHTGGTLPPLVDLSSHPDNLLGFGWLRTSLDSMDPNALLKVLADAPSKSLLILQPAILAIGASVAGLLKRPAEDPRRILFAPVATAVSVVTLAVASYAASEALAPQAPTMTSVAITAAVSLIAAVAVTGLFEWSCPPLPRKASVATRQGSMSAEDADVDELLRLIATAEDQLTSKHTTERIVMITDMKSFSKMTEEDGSVVSAKAIQRHRDLLLPVIERHGGSGKSTGGDGLVAAFTSAAEAISAAADMQSTLSEYNSAHDSERDIVVRIGMAQGEVVLDKGGRPFIGNALNLAARVMNLGDGGQILAAASVSNASGPPPGIRLASHGPFELKNIAEPVEVVEVLWSPDQAPLSPLGSGD